jgi:hypothetical protein
MFRANLSDSVVKRVDFFKNGFWRWTKAFPSGWVRDTNPGFLSVSRTNCEGVLVVVPSLSEAVGKLIRTALP